MTQLEQHLYQTLEQIRALSGKPLGGDFVTAAALLDQIEDSATLACASVWRSGGSARTKLVNWLDAFHLDPFATGSDKVDELAEHCGVECGCNSALAAAARQGGDVKQAPAESPQSGGDSRNAQKDEA